MSETVNPTIEVVKNSGMYRHIICMSEDLMNKEGGVFAQTGTIDPAAVRRINRRNILRLLYESRGLTRQEICKSLSLSIPTVTSVLQEMQQENQIELMPTQTTSAGRPPVKYCLYGKAHVCMSVLTEADSLSILTSDIYRNELINEKIIMPYEDSEGYWLWLAGHLRNNMKLLGISSRAVIGVNILLPCQVDPVEQCVVEKSESFPTENFSLDLLTKYIDAPVMLNNIYDAAAYTAIGQHGKNNEKESGIYLCISDIINTTYVISGRILRTRASEIGGAGHSCLVPGGLVCQCGKNGCVEAYCSTSVFKKNFNQSLESFFNTISDVPKQMFWFNYLRNTAMFIGNLINIFNLPVYLAGELADFLELSDQFGSLRDLVIKEFSEQKYSSDMLFYGGDFKRCALNGGIGILITNFI